VFIRKSSTGFCIISIYVDDLNTQSTYVKKALEKFNMDNGHVKDIDETRNHLKKEFEMKDFGTAKFYLDLQIEHLQTGILIHLSTYIKKALKKFNMDKAYHQ
jgi:hypothetical protein